MRSLRTLAFTLLSSVALLGCAGMTRSEKLAVGGELFAATLASIPEALAQSPTTDEGREGAAIRRALDTTVVSCGCRRSELRWWLRHEHRGRYTIFVKGCGQRALLSCTPRSCQTKLGAAVAAGGPSPQVRR